MSPMATTMPAFEDAEAALQALRRNPHHPGPVEMLFLITDSLHSSLDVEAIAEQLPGRLAREFRAETGAVVLPDGQGGLHVRGASADAVPMELIRQVMQSPLKSREASGKKVGSSSGASPPARTPR